MKLFSKPRKVKDIYTLEAMTDIADDLGISDTKDIENFKECLERAAVNFINSKSSNNTRYTEAKEKNKLKQLAKSLNKSKKLYSEITKNPQMTSFRFLDSLQNLDTEFVSIKEYLFQITHDGFFIESKQIENLLYVLEKASLDALKQPPYFKKKNKTALVLRWLCAFSDEWTELSSVTISEGKEYKSPSMSIFKKIKAPINKKLKSKDHITTSQIAEAIILYRNNKKVREPLQEKMV